MSYSEEKSIINPVWKYEDNPNTLLLFQKKFESELEVDGSRLFAAFKLKENNKWIRRNLFPTVLCQQISKAETDYNQLAKLFNLN